MSTMCMEWKTTNVIGNPMEMVSIISLEWSIKHLATHLEQLVK